MEVSIQSGCDLSTHSCCGAVVVTWQMQSDLAGLAVMKMEGKMGDVTLRDCWEETKLESYLECLGLQSMVPETQVIASGPSLCPDL